MLLMKMALWFASFVGFTIMQLVRFVLTICFGEEEAIHRAQAGTMQWLEQNQNTVAAFMRAVQSPVKVTMPQSTFHPSQFAPESRYMMPNGMEGACVIPAVDCRYSVVQTVDPSKPVPMYGFVITGPGLPPVVFVGPEPSFGPSVCVGLDMAYNAGLAEGRIAPCP